MLFNRLAAATLAVACVAAAGAGGYFASRQNTVPTSAAAASIPLNSSGSQVDHGTPAAADTTPSTVLPSEEPSAQPPAAVPAVTKTKRQTAARAAAAPVRQSPREPGRADSTVERQRTSAVASPLPSLAPVPIPGPPESAITARPDERAFQEPPPPPQPPQKTFEELVVSASSVIGLQTESRISSETARIEDRVEAKVTRDVKVGDKVAVPANSRAIGSVVLVERGGKFKERARIGLRFSTLVLADGTRLPISTETIYREGEAPGNGSAAKIGGGAVVGTILGAILGGSKGAAIGATAGATGGAVAVEAGDRNSVTLPAGSPMTVRLVAPVTVTIEDK